MGRGSCGISISSSHASDTSSAIMNAIVTIENHTTASAPRPHIVYDVKVTVNGKEYTTHKRYSDVRPRFMFDSASF